MVALPVFAASLSESVMQALAALSLTMLCVSWIVLSSVEKAAGAQYAIRSRTL
jgi:hypothetical protein